MQATRPWTRRQSNRVNAKYKALKSTYNANPRTKKTLACAGKRAIWLGQYPDWPISGYYGNEPVTLIDTCEREETTQLTQRTWVGGWVCALERLKLEKSVCVCMCACTCVSWTCTINPFKDTRCFQSSLKKTRLFKTLCLLETQRRQSHEGCNLSLSFDDRHDNVLITKQPPASPPAPPPAHPNPTPPPWPIMHETWIMKCTNENSLNTNLHKTSHTFPFSHTHTQFIH